MARGCRRKISAPVGRLDMRADCKLSGLSANEIFRPAPRRPLNVFALVALLFVCSIVTASARHRSRTSAGAPGDFAYYVLSLSWSPAFCLSSPGAGECNSLRRHGFIVHGLWPQYEQGWPENCDAHHAVADDVVRGIADLMPARS